MRVPRKWQCLEPQGSHFIYPSGTLSERADPLLKMLRATQSKSVCKIYFEDNKAPLNCLIPE